jgi:hypothetical protein
MSKIIDHETKWFQELAPRDYYNEGDLERTITHYIEIIFPDYIVFPFKQSLSNLITGKSSAADLGMVRKDYKEWYIIEVELGRHSKKEVLEQIHTFRHFTPTLSHSDYIFQKRNNFDKVKLETLITSVSPKLMVIVNENKEDWKPELKKLDCKMCVFQIYNDFENRKLYRLEGEYPIVYTSFCNCKYEKTLPYTIKILNNKELFSKHNVKSGDYLDIVFEGKKYKWKREDFGTDIFLTCESTTPPLDPISQRYKLNYYSTKTIVKTKKNFFSFYKRETIINHNTFVFIKD